MKLILVSRLKYLNCYSCVIFVIFWEFHLDKKPFKCPFNRCDRRFVEVDTLKNHVLDHDPIHRREFKLFQRVKVINDQGIYIIVYVDKSTNSFYLRLCDECEGDYGYQYVSAEKLYPISEPELNDIISVETGKAPNQKEYLDSLKLAIVTERKVHEDGHISWTIQFLINDE